MNSVVLDTHAAIWYLEQSPLLSASARRAIKGALGSTRPLYISAITLAEIVYLEEKGRVASGTLSRLLFALRRPHGGLVELPFNSLAAESMKRIERKFVPDMPDRMIAATALHAGLPLFTADRQIQGSGVPTIW